MSQYQDYGWENNDFTCAHPYILPTLIKLLPIDGSLILDVGCGNGAIANYLIKKGYNVYGIDASKSGIDEANKINPGRFFVQDIETKNLPKELESKAFSAIISTEVIEHLYDPRKYISFVKQILIDSGGGHFILSTPYHGYLKNLALALSGKFDNHFTALWDGGHIKFWSRKSITKLLNEFHFKGISFIGCGRIPYLWKSMIIHSRITLNSDKKS
jgi:2-polyprenyl-3-methyl-5-hydroxy-6-metoxy-1,4-benzoquinol methylase